MLKHYLWKALDNLNEADTTAKGEMQNRIKIDTSNEVE